MTAWDPDGTSRPDAPQYHGPAPVRSEADDTALCEFAEEADVLQRARSRTTRTGALGWFGAEKANEHAPVVPVDPDHHSLSARQWISIAAGVAACVVVAVAIALTPTSPTPTQGSNTIPAQTVPVVATALPRAPLQVRPAVPLLTLDRSASLSRSTAATVAVPAPAPAPATVVELRSVETPAVIPTAPAPLVSNLPIAPPAAPQAPLTSLVRAEATLRAPEPAAVTRTALDRDESDIRNLLDAYRDSYDRRDAVSTARLWPGVDTAALSRAFGTIASQQLDFEQCSLDVIGQRATARCNGSLQYVRRIGSDSPRSRSLSWDFEFDRSTGQWLISRVSAQ